MKSISVEISSESGIVSVDFPAHYVVCEECEGEGRIVDPGIECDGGGFTASEWESVCADDPDFAENYFGGTYDIDCPCCKGKRVVLRINSAAAKAQFPEEYAQFLKDEEEAEYFRRERESERRYGA